jgi:hypothetical protein
MAWKARQATAQNPLEVGLMESVTFAPARRARLRGASPIKQQLTAGIYELHPWMKAQQRSHFIRQSRRLQRPHRLPIEVRGARQAVGLHEALDDDDRQAGDAQ